MRIIDARLRPPFKSLRNMSFYAVKSGPMSDMLRPFFSPSAIQEDMDLLIKEMDEAQVSAGVVSVRLSDGVLNDDIVELMSAYPGRFYGLLGTDPWDDHTTIFDNIEKYILNGPCVGVGMELPFLAKQPLHCNDKQVYPIYEKCQSLGVPVYLQWGGMFAPNLNFYEPTEIDQVASDFPGLTLILAHAGWPYVTEMCYVGMNHPNVYLAPDRYMTPLVGGTEPFLTAVRYEMRKQICFSTAYPLQQMGLGVQIYKNLGLPDDIMEDVFANNIIRALKLDIK